jgi:HD-like signal output (HDOD) protein
MSCALSASSQNYKDLERLPPFPAIATKLIRVLSHDDANLREISNLIRADAALTSDLLRVVNSAVYGLSQPVASVQKAVTFLGFDKVRSFAMAISLKGFLHSAMRLDLVRSVWRQGLACGVLCDHLSAACSSSQNSDDRAYTTGLLHDIGRLGLFVAHPDEYAALIAGSDSASLMVRERQAFGMDHCEAGAWLAEKWDLPEEVREAVRWHHEPPQPDGSGLLHTVKLGVLLTGILGFDVVPLGKEITVQEVRAMLPSAAQYRFDPDPDELRNQIMAQLDAFD